MTGVEFRRSLQTRLDIAGLSIPSHVLFPLESYYQLLVRWNRKINLTALNLDPLTADAVDRLFTEPLSAGRFLVQLPSSTWFDLGSGGGSPAVPLLLIRPDLRLTMVEARERKVAFLREVVRSLQLDAEVEGHRFEDVALARGGQVGLITARAVRMDSGLFAAGRDLLVTNGVLAVFSSSAVRPSADFHRLTQVQLIPNRPSLLVMMRRVPRGTPGVC